MAACSDTLSSRARSLAAGATGITNLYHGAAGDLAQSETIDFIETPGALLLLKDEGGFDRLYFSAQSPGDLTNALARASFWRRRSVCDLVGPVDAMDPVCAALSEAGFRSYQDFRRMSLWDVPPVQPDAREGFEVQLADAAQASAIHRLLSAHFDALSEHLPSLQEVGEAVASQGVLMATLHGDLSGMLVHSRTGLTTTLRFLLVLPDYRNQGISATLLARYFHLSASCRRFLLWVRNGNEPAIRLYLRHRYRFDQLMDKVLWRPGEA